MKQIYFFLLALITFYPSYSTTNEGTIEISITGAKSNKGQFIIGVYANDQGFRNEKPLKKVVVKKNANTIQMQVVQIHCSAGEYGISILDDENSDEQMNYNWIGVPTEGFGFSNYYHLGLSKPQFDKFKFTVRAQRTSNVQIKLRYL